MLLTSIHQGAIGVCLDTDVAAADDADGDVVVDADVVGVDDGDDDYIIVTFDTAKEVLPLCSSSPVLFTAKIISSPISSGIQSDMYHLS